jgi:hypothetical protein
VTRTGSNGLPPAKGPEERSRSTGQHLSVTAPEEDLAHDVSNMSIEVWQPQVTTAPRPPELAIIPATPTDSVTIQPVQEQHSPSQYNGLSYPPLLLDLAQMTT